MLTDLREKSQHFLIYIAFGILIFVFIFFFGPQSEGCQARQGAEVQRIGWAATVDGTDVSQQEVEVILRRWLGFTSTDMPAAELTRMRRDALLQIVDQTFLAKRAASAGLAVSDDDINKYIVIKGENPDYGIYAKRDGKFDYPRFNDMVQQHFRTTVDEYRRIVARELLVRKYVDFLGNQVQVSEPEVREAFDRANRKWNLEYLAFDIDTLEGDAAAIALSEADGLAYADAHGEDVKKYFDDHKAQYDRGREVRLRRITVKLASDVKPEDKVAAKTKIDELLTAAKAEGADFAALAREKSEDTFKDDGGDMGWQSQDNTSPENYTLFSKLEAGQFSDVQESAFGYWFVRAEEVKPAIKKSISEAKTEIGVALATLAKKKDAARAKAVDALAKATAGVSFNEILTPKVEGPAPKTKAKVEPEVAEADEPEAPAVPETGDFSDDRPEYDSVPILGTAPKIVARLSDLSAEKPLIEEVIEQEERFLIVRLKARSEPAEADWTQKREEFTSRLRQRRKMAFVGPWEQFVLGSPKNRQMILQLGSSGLLGSLPDVSTDPRVQINAEAFPNTDAPAPASAAKKVDG